MFIYFCSMAEDLTILKGSKEEQYISIVPQIAALLQGEDDLIANMANVCAALKEQFNWFWVGFYMIKSDELVLGPFQGPVACTRIQKGKGVCGAAWAQNKVLIVPNVEEFPGETKAFREVLGTNKFKIIHSAFRSNAGYIVFE